MVGARSPPVRGEIQAPLLPVGRLSQRTRAVGIVLEPEMKMAAVGSGRLRVVAVVLIRVKRKGIIKRGAVVEVEARELVVGGMSPGLRGGPRPRNPARPLPNPHGKTMSVSDHGKYLVVNSSSFLIRLVLGVGPSSSFM